MHKPNTIFNRIDPDTMHPNEVLAVVFHRTAFILYCIYTLWAITGAAFNWNDFTHEAAHDFSDFFSFLVAPCAALAAIGALKFPKWGRMEMFAAATLVGFILIFLIIGFINAYNHPDISRLWLNLILNTTHIVLPVMRAGFVFRTLVWEAFIRRSRR